MLRRAFLQTAALAPAAMMAAATNRRPNVLLVTASHWRAQATPAADPSLPFPGLARLAEEGTVFRRAYTVDPQEAPARAALLTGRYPHANGVVDNATALPSAQTTLAGVLRKVGYRTGFIGLWELGGTAEPGFIPPGAGRHGFDYWAAYNRGHRFYDSRYFGDRPEALAAKGFEPDYQADLALEFLRQNTQEPFFLYVSWGAPHAPRNPPPRTADIFDPAAMVLRGNVPEDLTGHVRPEYASYYAMCRALDQDLERLLKGLDQAGMSADTVVVFTSDQGEMLGSHGMEDTGVAYEEAVRIPLLFRYPRRFGAKPQTSDRLVSSLDVAPTLLRLCQAEPMEGTQGEDLTPVLEGKTEEGPEAVFLEGKLDTAAEWTAVVRGLDKMVVNRDLEPTQLFNLGKDPEELVNQTHDSAQERRRDELSALLRDWMRRTDFRMDASGLKKRK